MTRSGSRSRGASRGHVCLSLKARTLLTRTGWREAVSRIISGQAASHSARGHAVCPPPRCDKSISTHAPDVLGVDVSTFRAARSNPNNTDNPNKPNRPTNSTKPNRPNRPNRPTNPTNPTDPNPTQTNNPTTQQQTQQPNNPTTQQPNNPTTQQTQQPNNNRPNRTQQIQGRKQGDWGSDGGRGAPWSPSPPAVSQPVKHSGST